MYFFMYCSYFHMFSRSYSVSASLFIFIMRSFFLRAKEEETDALQQELRELQRRLQDVDNAHLDGVSSMRSVTTTHELEVSQGKKRARGVVHHG